MKIKDYEDPIKKLNAVKSILKVHKFLLNAHIENCNNLEEMKYYLDDLSKAINKISNEI